MPDSTLRFVRTDYQSHREALLARVRARWPGLWTDFTSNNVGMMMVDLMAYTTSTLAYTINAAAAEQFIPTMALRESAVRLGALTGYQLRGPVPASLLCEATISQPGGTPGLPYLKISKGTTIRVTEAQLPFEVVRDYYIDGGQVAPLELVLRLDANVSGQQVLSTNVRVENGLDYIDAVDSTVDLAALVSPGQSVRRTTGDTTLYTVVSVEAPIDGGTYSRLYISPSWNGSPTDNAEVIPLEVYEQRIELVQGQTLTEQVITPQAETPGYSHKLDTSALDGSLTVTVNGTPWTQVSSLVTEPPESKSFEVLNLASGETVVVFGDGIFGALVPPDAVVVVTYRTGGGLAGNVPLNSVSTTITGYVVSLLNPVSVTLSNSTSPGQGGRDAETLEEARVNIPYHARTNDRAVTLDDWQTLAGAYAHPQHGSVAYARASVNVANSFLEGNVVYVHAWTTGPDNALVTLSPALKSALQQYLEAKAVGTDYPVVVDGTERPVPISLRFKTLAGYTVAATAAAVSSKLDSIIVSLRPGSTLVYSDLVRALDEVVGVDSVTLSTPTADLKASSPSELFTVPRAEFLYQLEREFSAAGTATVDAVQVPVNTYTVQLPIWPMAAWSFKLYLGSTELTLVPDTEAGYARVFGSVVDGSGIVDDDDGLFKSRVNLLTGQGEFTLSGSPGDLSMALVPVQGYDRERQVDIYVGYVGTNTVEKRNEIRAALRAWADGLGVGSALFAREVAGLAVSRSNVTEVVRSLSGVNAVNRVALENPANTEDRASAGGYELLRLGTIVLNNHTV